MSLTVIKDIETFFSNTETAVSDKLSEVVGALKGASADVVKKTVAIAHVAEHLAEAFAADVDNTWEKLDAQSTADVVAGVVDNLNAKNYETAALGVVYLIYQSAVEATSKVEAAAAPVVASVEAKAEGVVQAIEAEAGKVWTEVKTDVEAVVGKVEGLFHSSPVAPAPIAPVAVAGPVAAVVVTPAPEVAAAVVPPQPQPVPVQAPVVAAKPTLAS